MDRVSEIANRTAHAVLHVGWVPDGKGVHRSQMTVLVRPNGLFGKIYLSPITLIRRSIVYPRLIGSVGKNWPRYS